MTTEAATSGANYVRDIIADDEPMGIGKKELGEDSQTVGCMTYDEEMMSMMCILGVSPNNFKRGQRQARRRMVAE